jgi:carotenoid cleavage dioxygenase-like enzyme
VIAEQQRAAWAAGLESIASEVPERHLPIDGALPSWLEGTLIRNGPARFELGADACRHWFDGLAMLHRFSFAQGRASYACKFLASGDYAIAEREGRRAYSGFASEPRRTLGRWLLDTLRRPPPSENANVNIARIGGASLALTEAPKLVELSLDTLETRGCFDFEDELPLEAVTTAHPLVDRTGRVFNIATHIARRSFYRVWSLAAGSKKRETVAELPVDRPAYVHSFGLSENHLVLAEGPFVVKPTRFLFPGTPFIENFRWQPERGGRFRIVSLADGSVRTFESDPFFTFHFVNAFEAGGELFADLTAYADANIVRALYLDPLRRGDPIPAAELRRYRFSGSGGTATFERIGDVSFELPRTAYGAAAGRPYQYTYGVSSGGDGFSDRVLKIDVRGGASSSWAEADTFTGEPVFVARPGAEREDDGVVLSLVLDAARARSILIVLDAASFAERARVVLPHVVPFGFHGQFFSPNTAR